MAQQIRKEMKTWTYQVSEYEEAAENINQFWQFDSLFLLMTLCVFYFIFLIGSCHWEGSPPALSFSCWECDPIMAEFYIPPCHFI